MQGAGTISSSLIVPPCNLSYRAITASALPVGHFGVGYDLVLVVEKPRLVRRFYYRVFDDDGGEVEQCENLYALLRKVRDAFLASPTMKRLHVKTLGGFGRSAPRARRRGPASIWASHPGSVIERPCQRPRYRWYRLHGNPLAVQVVPDVASAPVTTRSPLDRDPSSLPGSRERRIHAGARSPRHRAPRLGTRCRRTLACGTGACAAVVAGISRNLLDSPVTVQTRGGTLTIAWPGGDNAVVMKGPP